MKKIFLITLLFSSLYSKAFYALLDFVATPSDAKIYIDNVYKGDGKAFINLYEVKEVEVRIEREGYTPYKMIYSYKGAKPNTTEYGRGENKFKITILQAGSPLIKNSIVSNATPTTQSNNPEVNNKSQILPKIEMLVKENYLTADEAVVLKDNVLDNKNEGINTVNELSCLRKHLNSSFITKEDFVLLKNKILKTKYDFTAGVCESLNKLIIKSESPDYTKDDIERLKKQLINAYKQ